MSPNNLSADATTPTEGMSGELLRRYHGEVCGPGTSLTAEECGQCAEELRQAIKALRSLPVGQRMEAMGMEALESNAGDWFDEAPASRRGARGVFRMTAESTNEPTPPLGAHGSWTSPVGNPAEVSLQEFTARLRELAEDWRWSDEYIGLWVRARWPRRYGDG